MRFVILLVSVISTACSLSVPNSEVCIELPSGSAFCRNTLSENERRLSKIEWDSISIGRLSMTPEDFGKYQKFIERSCELSKCNEEEKAAQKRAMRIIKGMKIDGL